MVLPPLGATLLGTNLSQDCRSPINSFIPSRQENDISTILES